MARGSILRDSEREYLWSEGCYLDERGTKLTQTGVDRKCNVSEKHARSRVNNEVTADLREIIKQFRKDLAAITRYNTSRREGGWYEYESSVLPKSKRELKQLRDQIGRLIERAERDLLPERDRELREGIAELWADLPVYKEINEGDIQTEAEVLEQDRNEDGTLEVVGPPEFIEEQQEYQQREKALIGVLENQDLVEILEYLKANGETTLPKEWRSPAGRFLVNQYALVEKDDTWQNNVKYQLTDRGKAVWRVWNHLKNLPVVDEISAGKGKRETVHHLLNLHFGLG